MRAVRSWGWTGVVVALLWGGASAIAAAATPAAVDPAAASAAPVDIGATIRQRMDEAGLVGLGAAIIVDRKLVWTGGYGFADQARGVPFTADTVMNIGSISKTVTGVALMQAVQDGKLSLDEDINRYLPFHVANPAFPDTPITLRQLATHTSSLTDRWAVYRDTYHWGGEADESLGDFMRGYLVPGGRHYAAENFLKVRPGIHREYSNIGAGLAGYIVERAVGEPLDRYTRRTIFQPLGMDRSAWRLADVPAGTHSTLYVGQSGLSIPIPPYGLTTYPDGGVRTSVNDLSRFFIALLDGGQYQGKRILSPEATADMLRFQYTAGHHPDNVELSEKNSGIFWSTKFNVTRIGHGGSDPGVRTEMLSDLSHDTAVVLMVNTSVEGAEAKVYADLLADLWAHADALRRQGAAPR